MQAVQFVERRHLVGEVFGFGKYLLKNMTCCGASLLVWEQSRLYLIPTAWLVIS